MKMIFEIDKPVSDMNYFTLGIKYIVLTIVFFIASWIILPFLTVRKKITGGYSFNFFEKIIEGHYVKEMSLLISILIVSFFIYRAWKKINYGEIYRLEFDDERSELNILSINLINDKLIDKTYDYEFLVFILENKTDPFFGEQRIIKIYYKGNVVHDINLERSGWWRYDKIDELIERVKGTEYNNS